MAAYEFSHGLHEFRNLAVGKVVVMAEPIAARNIVFNGLL